MDWFSLAFAVALAASLPVATLVVGILFHRPASGRWLRRHGRGFGWVAVVGFGVSLAGRWFSPGDASPLAFGFSVVAFLGMLVFVLSLPSMIDTD